MKDVEKMLMGAFLLIAFVTLMVMIPSSDSSDNTNAVAEAIFDGEWKYSSELFEIDQKDTNVLHLKDGSAGDGEEQSEIIITLEGCNDKNHVGIVDDRTHRSPPLDKGDPYRYGNVTVQIAYYDSSLPSVSQDINVEITNSRSDSLRVYYVGQQNESVKCSLNIVYKTKSNNEFETLHLSSYESGGINKHYFDNVKISGSPNCDIQVKTFGATIKDKMEVKNFDTVYFDNINASAKTLDMSSREILIDDFELTAENVQISNTESVKLHSARLTVTNDIALCELTLLDIRKGYWKEPSVITCEKITSDGIEKIEIESSEINCKEFSTNNYKFNMHDSTVKAEKLNFGNDEFASNSLVVFEGTNKIIADNVKFEGYDRIIGYGLLNIESNETTFHGNEFIIENEATFNQNTNKDGGRLSIEGDGGSESSSARICGKIYSESEINFSNFNGGIEFSSPKLGFPAIEGKKTLKIDRVLSIYGETDITAMKANAVIGFAETIINRPNLPQSKASRYAPGI